MQPQQPDEEEEKVITITFYRNGFMINDDGKFMSYDDEKK